jgi:hypothetical protein
MDSNALSIVYNANVLPFSINVSASSCPITSGTLRIVVASGTF